MAESCVVVDVSTELLSRTKQARELLIQCENMPEIQGKKKLMKRICAELCFLEKLSNSKNLKPDHIKSSNLSHLSAIARCCSDMDGSIKILEPFVYHYLLGANSLQRRLIVDVVCDHGKTWVKVIARNPTALLQLSAGAGKFGQKSITEQVADIIECAKQNKYMFEPPNIKVWLLSNFVKELKDLLNQMNVEVIFSEDNHDYSFSQKNDELDATLDLTVHKTKSELFPIHCRFIHDKDCFGHPSHSQCDLTLCSIPGDAVLNLDVSTMIAYVSNLTNGGANAKFADGILCEQAKREIISPVRNIFNKLFKGHKLICCSAAYDDFKDIVSCVGGNTEKERASEFLKQLTIVSNSPSEQAMNLRTSSRIKKRSKVIFGTGDTQKAITVTANFGFLRAAQGQGVKFVAVFHESRALSEMKELEN